MNTNEQLSSYLRSCSEGVQALIEALLVRLSSLKLKQDARNRAIRLDIVNRLVGQLLTDDERAEMMGLPLGCRIREGAKILSPERLVIGEHCWIGEGAIIDASGGLEIGSHTSIGSSVFVWSHSSHLSNLTFQNRPGSRLIQHKPTKIGRGCFIAGPSVIMPGVTIGDQVVIRAMSRVDRDVPDRSLVDRDDIRENAWIDASIKKMVARQLGTNRKER
jgi:acetyltransferase-like isoleucine patch superfamily enzyme